ncbi:ABC transporter permease subunit [Cobetia sp. QF-1]|uniref:ABC transporter permease subunit n=1 Tax=Cobetia sp. QF-1 TaxID=1969833 RepID=UPI000B541D89|nr:ABC transporter permease subunit [Cobetia sp. QF-1]
MSAVDASRMQRRRLRRDRLASLWLTASGLGVMAVVIVMLGYLFSVSWPLLMPASTRPMTPQGITATVDDESRQLADLLALPTTSPIARAAAAPLIATGSERLELAGIWLADGRLQPVQIDDSAKIPTVKRLATLTVPTGLSRSSTHLMINDDQLWMSASESSGSRLWLARLSLSDSDAIWQQQWLEKAGAQASMAGRLLITAGEHDFQQWQLAGVANEQGPLAHIISRGTHVPARITALRVLRGGESLILGDDTGGLTHYLQPGHALPLVAVGTFDSGLNAPIVALSAAHRSLGFAALDATGRLGLYQATAERKRLVQDWLTAQTVAEGVTLAFSRNDHQLVATGSTAAAKPTETTAQALVIDDPHPDVGLSTLLGKVWYEGRPAPEWIWQMGDSSSEPRLSLVPIVWGTLKAALVGLLFAVPLGLGCAIHVSCFMAPRQRSRIKPLLEMMEALPTVVIGFIAALVVAPFVERELMAVLLGLVLIPLGTMVAGFVWTLAPRDWRVLLPENMAAFGLLPLLVLLLWLDITIANHVEHWWFEGDIKQWLFSHYGIGYAQRNTLVTGMALGLAVMPTLFTLSEDALSSVPRGLAAGSAALGATPWQSLRRVILPAAAVGVCSALMIGMGRAVGETMIVLMVAGNTPLVDASLFEGLRSLAATIAIELPEADVGSSHYRLLFLAALALFLFTFIVNTFAEVLRQRFAPPTRGGWG